MALLAGMFHRLSGAGYFLREIFFGIAGIGFLMAGSDLLFENAFANNSIESEIDEGRMPDHESEPIDHRQYFELNLISFSHIANCSEAKIISELEQDGSRIYLNIQVVGSISNGCTEHYLYISSAGRVETSTRTGLFSYVRVDRLEQGEISDFGDSLPLNSSLYADTLMRLTLKEDDFSYWASYPFGDDVFWGNEEYTSEESGSIQGRVRIRFDDHLLEWGRPWYLPYSLAPVITKLIVEMPSAQSFRFWRSFSDIGYDPFERHPSGFFQKLRRFEYPNDEKLEQFYFPSDIKSRLRADHPIIMMTPTNSEAIWQTMHEFERRWESHTSLLKYSGFGEGVFEFLLMPQNFDDRVDFLFVVAGVWLGFGLALVVEVLGLLLGRLESELAKGATRSRTKDGFGSTDKSDQ